MTTTPDQDMQQLVAFLTARLNEDETAAQAAMWDEQSGTWTARPARAAYEQYTVVDYCDDGVVAVTPENADADGVGQHIARHDPDRVLRAVAAKRRTLADYVKNELGSEEWPLFPLLNMAAEHSDHPDFQAWWPTGA